MARTLSVSHFTNPHGEDVWQAFCGGMPITRETDEVTARAALDRAEEEGRRLGSTFVRAEDYINLQA